MQLPRGSGRMGRLCVHWAAGAALELVVVGGWGVYVFTAGCARDVDGSLDALGAPLLARAPERLLRPDEEEDDRLRRATVSVAAMAWGGASTPRPRREDRQVQSRSTRRASAPCLSRVLRARGLARFVA